MILYVDYLKHFKNFFSIVRLFVSLPDLKNVEQEVGFKFESRRFCIGQKDHRKEKNILSVLKKSKDVKASPLS